jgi:hypothetical protein
MIRAENKNTLLIYYLARFYYQTLHYSKSDKMLKYCDCTISNYRCAPTKLQYNLARQRQKYDIPSQLDFNFIK